MKVRGSREEIGDVSSRGLKSHDVVRLPTFGHYQAVAAIAHLSPQLVEVLLDWCEAPLWAPSLARYLGRLGDDPQIRPGRLPAAGILLFGFLVRYCRRDDHIFAVLPVHRSCDLVGSRELNRIENP